MRHSFLAIAFFAAGAGVAVLNAASCFPFGYESNGAGGKGGASSTTATVGTGGSGGSGGQVPCSPTVPCPDDKNPCTTEACKSGFCAYTALNVPAGPESTECVTIACVNGASTLPVIHENATCGMGLKCNAAGQCAGCMNATECPAPPDCQTVSCVATVCTLGPAPKGTPSVKVINSPNDCKKPVCDGTSGVEFADDNTDLPIADTNPCTDPVCIMGAPMYPPSAAGKACISATNNKAKVCDGMGACVECTANAACTMGMTPSCDLVTHTCISCSDGLQNGAETGKDCGGLCPKCIGDPCGQGAECRSLTCSDAVCCDAACIGSCVACDLPGEVGKCSPVPKGLGDVQCIGGIKACDGSGICASGVTGKAGAGCVNDGDCYSSACNGVCRLANFAPCIEDAECASLHCKANVCTACSFAGDCASSQCTAGRCLNPGGGICNDNSDCADGTCDTTTHLCGKSLGATCLNGSDCATHYCNAMNKCAACSVATQATDCASQLCDAVGSCLLLKDAPCTADPQCASGTCNKTFPSRCQ